MDDSSEILYTMNLNPCSNCGRKFNPESLARHETICKKSQKSRKVFDSSKQRARGTELEHFKLTHKPSPPNAHSNLPRQRTLSWRQKHEDFIQSIRAAKQITDAIKSGAPLPPPTPAPPNPDYIQCTYCQRHFEYNTAQRHIPFCKQQSSRIQKNSTPENSKAKKSLSKRMSYKPPPIKKKSANNQQATGDGSRGAPPGSSLVKQNTNFTGSNYTPFSVPLYTRSDTGEKEYSRSALKPPEVQAAAPDNPESKFRTTAFSRVKKTLVSNMAEPEKRPQEGAVAQKTKKPPSSTNASRSESHAHYKPSHSASRRLFAALEYSDHSSDDGGNLSNNENSSSVVNKEEEKKSEGPSARLGRTADKMQRSTPVENIKRSSVHEAAADKRSLVSNGAVYKESLVDKYHVKKDKASAPTVNRVSSSRGSAIIPDSFVQSLEEKVSLSESFTRTYNGSSSDIFLPHSSSSHSSMLLNEHGMPKSKYCYECGAKFPVPQAKYCCECGTKRI